MIVAVGEIFAGMSAARFRPVQRAHERHMRGVKQVPKLDRFQKIGIELISLIVDHDCFIFLFRSSPILSSADCSPLASRKIPQSSIISCCISVRNGAGLLPVVRDLISAIFAFVTSPAFAGSVGYSAPALRYAAIAFPPLRPNTIRSSEANLFPNDSRHERCTHAHSSAA